ncbi:unnamed protein product [Prunus armeniaca]|uniref:Uncharacterized protein n=1 Tax=Prunus armeniaca TaxID=36596 RepID=A0A6J5XSD2_PRUAR|nr:unnamed protein product [Prunus armeniaca]
MSGGTNILHTETFDLSRTRVSENDQDSASAELQKDVETYARPNVSKEIEPVRSTEPVIVTDDLEAQLLVFLLRMKSRRLKIIIEGLRILMLKSRGLLA